MPLSYCSKSDCRLRCVCERPAMIDAPVSPLWRKLARRLCGSEVLRVRRWQVPATGRPRSHGRDTGSEASNTAAWPTLSYVAVAALAAGIYWNSVDGQFVHDDIVAVVKNSDVRPGSPLVDILRHDFWGHPISSERSHKSYRPLCVATFRSDNCTQQLFCNFCLRNTAGLHDKSHRKILRRPVMSS